MEKIIVHGGQPLKGTVHIEGAKNAVLPIQAASLLASTGELILTNVPALSDVFMMNKVLSFLNVSVDFDRRVKSVTFNASKKVGF